MKKITLLCIIISWSLILSGCVFGIGKGWARQIISFDTYTLEISERFVPNPKHTVENKQILNKVIGAWRVDNPTWFDENIIISKSSLPPKLDYEQFRSVNTNKLKRYIQWYTPGEKELKRFSCNDRNINGIFVTFSSTDSFYKNENIYYIAQFQFVDQEHGYIISHASTNPDDQDLLSKRIKSLSCISQT